MSIFSPRTPLSPCEGVCGGKKCSEDRRGGLTPPRLHSRPSSAAAAALRALMSRGTGIAAAVCCSVWFGAFAKPTQTSRLYRVAGSIFVSIAAGCLVPAVLAHGNVIAPLVLGHHTAAAATGDHNSAARGAPLLILIGSTMPSDEGLVAVWAACIFFHCLMPPLCVAERQRSVAGPGGETLQLGKPTWRPGQLQRLVRPSSAFLGLAAKHGFEADFRADRILDIVDEVRRCTSDELLRAGIKAAPVRIEHLVHPSDRNRQGKRNRPHMRANAAQLLRGLDGPDDPRRDAQQGDRFAGQHAGEAEVVDGQFHGTADPAVVLRRSQQDPGGRLDG